MPLSKLFHKRNSRKGKKSSSNSSDAGPCANEASTSAKCDIKNEETVNKDSSSTEQLTPSIETLTGKHCDSKEKVPTFVQQQPSPTTEIVNDSPCESQFEEVRHEGSTEQLSSKAESILDMSSDCKSEDIPIGSSTSTEHLITKTESVIEAPSGLKNEQDVDSTTEQVITTSTTITNVPCDFMSEDVSKLNSKSTEQLLPVTETVIDGYCDNEKSGNVASISSEHSFPTIETVKDMSCDSKDEVNIVDSSATQQLSLKTEKNPGVVTHEVTQGDTHQVPDHVQEQNDEPVLNSKETGSSIVTCIHPENNASSSAFRELGQPNENMDVREKSSKNKTRPSSFKEAGSKPPAPAHSKIRRRKCESESAASNSTDDEGFEDRVLLQFREKDLEEVIGRCVNRLIRESIAMAVRGVDVEGLCDEVIKTISDRSQSESSGTSECLGTVEQKLHTNSVEEYADLEMLETFEDSLDSRDEVSEIPDETLEGKIAHEGSEIGDPKTEIANEDDCSCRNMDEVDGSMSGNAIALSEDKEIDLDGYRADLEESTSLHSLTKDTNKSNGCMSNIENETGDKEHTKITKSDSCHAGIEESNAHATNKENTSEEAVNVDENPFENTTPEDSKSSGGNFNEDAVEPSAEPRIVADLSLIQDSGEISKKNVGMLRVESEDLISMSDESVSELLSASDQMQVEEEQPPDLGMNLPQQNPQTEEGKKVNWKVGYLHVKLPPKSRGKGQMKAWKKRCVAIHPDEFANDPKDPWLMISVYSGESGHARKHSASFWKSVSCRKAVVYRSSSSSHRYAFTIADDGKPVVHLSADSEALSQEWMAAVRSVLWPPSPVVQLEKMLNGSQFEVSLIDNEFSYRAGLLGMYGHLTITPKKLILVHPQQGYVIQEWYLNTVDRFELMQQTRIEDVHKVLCMTTCSDSSTGKGEILIFCREAVTLLQSLASTIHQILTYHSKQEGGKYRKELEEMAEWLDPSTSSNAEVAEEYYKVPPRQVRSLLDIPNFIFDKPLTPVASVACALGIAMDAQKTPLLAEVSKTNPSRASQDSGISAGAAADDFLNCSVTSFVVGGGNFPTGKSSDSELSDSYTPPVSSPVKVKHGEEKKVQVNA